MNTEWLGSAAPNSGIWRGGIAGQPGAAVLVREYNKAQWDAWIEAGHDYEACAYFDLRVLNPVCDCWRMDADKLERLEQALKQIAEHVDEPDYETVRALINIARTALGMEGI